MGQTWMISWFVKIFFIIYVEIISYTSSSAISNEQNAKQLFYFFIHYFHITNELLIPVERLVEAYFGRLYDILSCSTVIYFLLQYYSP